MRRWSRGEPVALMYMCADEYEDREYRSDKTHVMKINLLSARLSKR